MNALLLVMARRGRSASISTEHKQLHRRRMIFNELKATEENYHKALTTTVNIFLNPLRDALGTENEGTPVTTPMCGW